MTSLITISGNVLTNHFRHRDALQTCLDFRMRYGHLFGRPLGQLSPDSDIMLSLASRFGQDHEVEVLQELRDRWGDQLVSIPSRADDAGKIRQLRMTRQAMRTGKQLIHGGFLRMEGSVKRCARDTARRFQLPAELVFWGEPDLLRRIDAPGCGSIYGDWYYQVADVKSARSSKLPARLQVAFYSWLISDMQGFSPARGWILPRPLEPDAGSITRWEEFDIGDYLPIVELFLREEYWQLVLSEPVRLLAESRCSEPLAAAWAASQGYFPDALCDCHVSALPNMRRPVSRRLQRAGIVTIGQLAATADDQIGMLAGPGVTLDGLRKQRVQAEACCAGRPRWRDRRYRCLQDVVDAVSANAANADGEVMSVALDDPDAAYVHFDIEGDPFVDLEYLFGYQLDVPGRRPRPAGSYEPPCQLWAESPTARHERRIFEDFLTAMEAVERQFGSVVILHYASYEVTRLQQLARRYPTSEDGQDNQARAEWAVSRMLDLYKVARRAFYLPFPSYSIKDVAPGLEQLPAPGGPGRGHVWLQMNSFDRLASALAGKSWSAGEIEDALRAVTTAAIEWGIDNARDVLTASAAMSVFWYQRYCDTGEPVWRFLIELYNADDLQATQRLFDYLVRLERQGLTGVDDGPSQEQADGGA